MRPLTSTASKAVVIKRNVRDYCKCVHFRPKHWPITCEAVSKITTYLV